MDAQRAVLQELHVRFRQDDYTDEGKKGMMQSADPFWSRSFERLFMHSVCHHRDDLLFYVKTDTKTRRETVDVLRRVSKSLPDLFDESILWDQTLYLNLILHEFDFQLTCAVVSYDEDSTTPILSKRITMQVYPSPMERRMDKKSHTSELIFPDLTFCIDNFEEMFGDISLTCEGQKVAVQIIAKHSFLGSKVVFLGALDQSVLKKVCIAREMEKEREDSALIRWFSSKPKKADSGFCHDYHFMRMRGPNRKGYAEMAVHATEVDDITTSELTHEKAMGAKEKASVCNGSIDSHPITFANHTYTSLASDSSHASVASRTLTSPISGRDLVVRTDEDDVIVRTINPAMDSTARDSQSHQSIDRTTSEIGTEETLTAGYGVALASSCISSSSDTGHMKNTSATNNSRSPWRMSRTSTSKKELESKDFDSRKPQYVSHKNWGEKMYLIYAYLTFVRLPWYTIVSDILNGTKEPLL